MPRYNAPEAMATATLAATREVSIPAGPSRLSGTLALPAEAAGIVLFAHGSGSSRRSPRNIFVADALQEAGIGTLLFDLLTPEEEARDLSTREHRFDIDLLARRLIAATAWIVARPRPEMAIGYFGASTGSAAALVAAAHFGARIGAVVSRGGRPDLAGEAVLARVHAPTLLIVGGDDLDVLRLNETALGPLSASKELAIIDGASHLFEEPGALEQVANLASRWFRRHFEADVR